MAFSISKNLQRTEKCVACVVSCRPRYVLSWTWPKCCSVQQFSHIVRKTHVKFLWSAKATDWMCLTNKEFRGREITITLIAKFTKEVHLQKLHTGYLWGLNLEHKNYHTRMNRQFSVNENRDDVPHWNGRGSKKRLWNATATISVAKRKSEKSSCNTTTKLSSFCGFSESPRTINYPPSRNVTMHMM